jgi:group I intron endonuclease
VSKPISGVYEILNTETGDRYIGSAVNIASRLRTHIACLRAGKHHSPILQRSWAKRGEAAFQCSTLLICSRENLLMYEQIAFDSFGPKYNIAKIAGSCIGIVRSDEFKSKISAFFRGKKRPEISAATKGKPKGPMSDAHRRNVSLGRRGISPGPCRQETKEKIRAANQGKTFLTPEQYELIAAKNRGRKQTAEHVAKAAAARALVKRKKYRRHSPEANAAKAARQRIAAEGDCHV